MFDFWIFFPPCILNYRNCQHSHLKHPRNGACRHRDVEGWHTGLHFGRTPEQGHRASHTAVHHYHPNNLSLHHNARLEAHTEHQSHSWTHRTYKLEERNLTVIQSSKSSYNFTEVQTNAPDQNVYNHTSTVLEMWSKGIKSCNHTYLKFVQ